MYKAVIARVQNILPHDNADRLEILIVCNTPVIVFKDLYTKDQLVVFFASDGQLSREFAVSNDLLPMYADIDGVKTKTNNTFFDDNLRVKPINLRSKRSDGFVLPLSCLDFTGASVKEGDEFDILNGIPICNKYVTKATREARAAQPKVKRLQTMTTTFHEHIDTKNIYKELERIDLGSRIIISEKQHGTSQRSSRAYTTRTRYNPVVRKVLQKLNVTKTNETIQKCWNWLANTIDTAFATTTQSYEFLCGTRRVILDSADNNNGYYGSDKFRWVQHNKFAAFLHKGEEVFYEIVGYTTTGQPIQPAHNTAKTGDKAFIKKHGTAISYDYGCLPSTAAMYVYRICITNEDGVQIDLSWDQVVARCEQLGLQTVPVLCVLNPNSYAKDQHDTFLEFVEFCSKQDSKITGQTFSEGVVVRVEKGLKVDFYKLKSHEFKLMESWSKDIGEIDIEEAQDIQ